MRCARRRIMRDGTTSNLGHGLGGRVRACAENPFKGPGDWVLRYNTEGFDGIAPFVPKHLDAMVAFDETRREPSDPGCLVEAFPGTS